MSMCICVSDYGNAADKEVHNLWAFPNCITFPEKQNTPQSELKPTNNHPGVRDYNGGKFKLLIQKLMFVSSTHSFSPGLYLGVEERGGVHAFRRCLFPWQNTPKWASKRLRVESKTRDRTWSFFGECGGGVCMFFAVFAFFGPSLSLSSSVTVWKQKMNEFVLCF